MRTSPIPMCELRRTSCRSAPGHENFLRRTPSYGRATTLTATTPIPTPAAPGAALQWLHENGFTDGGRGMGMHGEGAAAYVRNHVCESRLRALHQLVWPCIAHTRAVQRSALPP